MPLNHFAMPLKRMMRNAKNCVVLLLSASAIWLLLNWAVVSSSWVLFPQQRAATSDPEVLHSRKIETAHPGTQNWIANTTPAHNLTWATENAKNLTPVSAYDDIFSLPVTNDSVHRLFDTHDVSDEPYSLLWEYYHRAQQAHDHCSKTPSITPGQGQLLGIFTHAPSRVAYCFLPKAGCTFWIRVFSFVNNFTGQAGLVKTPWELLRYAVHNNPHSHGRLWGQVSEEASHYLRFLFVRHPFSRLWSAYLDKLYLPDFWLEVGVPAVFKARGANATAGAKRCGNDVTFPEFLEYSLQVYEPHWEPVHARCDPCVFRPAVVGKMETFERDSRFLLRRMGLEWVLRGVDRQQQTEQELSTLIVYNFDLLHARPFYNGCLDDLGLARRLWDTFQMNGYIPDDVRYVLSPSNGTTIAVTNTTASTSFSVRAFQEHVLSTVRRASDRKEELKAQKRRYIHAAFDAVSDTLLEKLLAKYQSDMLLFGFNKRDF